jgi:hypothetical protein
MVLPVNVQAEEHSIGSARQHTLVEHGSGGPQREANCLMCSIVGTHFLISRWKKGEIPPVGEDQ